MDLLLYVHFKIRGKASVGVHWFLFLSSLPLEVRTVGSEQ